MNVPAERIGKNVGEMDLIWLSSNLWRGNGHHLDYPETINILTELIPERLQYPSVNERTVKSIVSLLKTTREKGERG